MQLPGQEYTAKGWQDVFLKVTNCHLVVSLSYRRSRNLTCRGGEMRHMAFGFGIAARGFSLMKHVREFGLQS